MKKAASTKTRLQKLEEAGKHVLEYPLYFVYKKDGIQLFGEIKRLEEGE